MEQDSSAWQESKGRGAGQGRTLDAIRWVTEPSIRWLHVAPNDEASFHQSKLRPPETGKSKASVTLFRLKKREAQRTSLAGRRAG